MRVALETEAWVDVAGVDADLAVVPVGSTEQHGPHAPLGTDTVIATAVADRAAERYADPVVVTPAVPVAVAEEHRAFAGTLWTSESTFRAYVRDIVDSLAAHGWDRTVIVNGHGGNTAPLREVAARISRHDDAYAVPFTWFEAVDDEMGHGGPLETSLLRCVAPETVHEDRLADAAENGAERWGDWQSGTNLAFDSEEFSPNGVVGDPREGSTERGERLLEAATDSLLALFDVVAERRID